MKQFWFLVGAALGLAACGEVSGSFADVDVGVQQPSDRRLIVGVWSGNEEITTDEDIASNLNYPGTGGFDFPVVINFESGNRFTLWTANFPTSYDNESDRTCSGVYTHSGNVLEFYPSRLCRALPMTRFNIGTNLAGDISFEARTNTSGGPSYASIHVRFHLSRD